MKPRAKIPGPPSARLARARGAQGSGSNYSSTGPSNTMVPSGQSLEEVRRAQLNTAGILMDEGCGEDEVRAVLGMLGLLHKTGLEVHDVWGQRIA